MFKAVISAALLSLAAPALSAAAEALPAISVVKQASCGCCAGWVQRMQEAGFRLSVQNVDDAGLIAAKRRAGMPEETWGCHTAFVAGYAIEGHVPAADIRRLLQTRPEAVGLATPGMPAGAPGMEYGNRRNAYDVLLVRADGSTEVLASYPGN